MSDVFTIMLFNNEYGRINSINFIYPSDKMLLIMFVISFYRWYTSVSKTTYQQTGNSVGEVFVIDLVTSGEYITARNLAKYFKKAYL